MMETTGALAASRNRVGEGLGRVASLDLSQRVPFAILAFIFLVARAPFLSYGYGTDPDAWRVAVTGQYLFEHGKYFPSRLPGNPLHELVLSPFVMVGWETANFVTALAALAGVWVFARIVSEVRLQNGALVTVGFAFTPLLFINSVAGMDYMWTLTAILSSYYAVIKRRPLVGGLFWGIAIGFRLQSLIAGVPIAYLMWRRGEWRSVLPFGFSAGGVAALSFAPVLATYGLEFATFYDAKVEAEVVARLLGKEALGILGGLAVLTGLALSIRRLASVPRDLIRDYHLGVWLLFIGLFTFSFLRLPHEIAYMVPVFPFGLMFLGRYLARPVLAGVITAILVAGFVDITTPSDDLTLSAFREARPGKGLLLSNVETQENQHNFVKDILRGQVPDHSVVIAGFVYPQLAMRERERLDLRILERDYDAISMLSDRGESVDAERDVRYVWLLTYEAFQALRSQGYSFFIVPDAAGGTAALYDYRPSLFGATFLPLERPSPSAGKGTASTDR